MERYAPHAKDLASRDVVSRAISLEFRAGNGFDPDNINYVKLKLDHLGAEVINSRLPGIRELAITFAHTDPLSEPIPVTPVCHYMMGGIPTNKYGQVVTLGTSDKDQVVEGFYAIGECANVSVHGANRLGSNSLLDLVVFGHAVGSHAEKAIHAGLPLHKASDSDIDIALARLQRWNNTKTGEDFNKIRHAMQKTMQEYFGVFRQETDMRKGLEKLETLREQLHHAALKDSSETFNTARIQALELDNLMEVAYVTAVAALTREESRGAHSREDFPKRDDKNWLKHLLVFSDGLIRFRPVNMKPETVDPFPPTERVY